MTLLADSTADRELMRAARRGNLEALDQLFTRHHRRLYSFPARLTNDRDAADDLVQDVFLRLVRFHRSYRDDGELLPWLFSIARNVAADWHRAARPTVALDDQDAALSSDDSGPLERMIEGEDHQRLERALAALPMSHRDVLLLRGTEELSNNQLAAALGCSEGAARVRFHRALAALKREWYALVGDAQ